MGEKTTWNDPYRVKAQSKSKQWETTHNHQSTLVNFLSSKQFQGTIRQISRAFAPPRNLAAPSMNSSWRGKGNPRTRWRPPAKKKNYCWWIFQHFPRFDYHTGGFASKLLLSQIFLIPGSAAVAPKPMLSILRGVRSRKIVIAWLEREGQSLQYPKLNFDGPFFNSEKKRK